MKMCLFKKNESGYHESAVKILAGWVNGMIEIPFYIDGSIVFIPDVACFENGLLISIYEVVHSHPLSAKKYGMIQYWCYRKIKELTVFEVSSDFILSQTSKPDRIVTMECYIVNPFEYDEITDDLVKAVI